MVTLYWSSSYTDTAPSTYSYTPLYVCRQGYIVLVIFIHWASTQYLLLHTTLCLADKVTLYWLSSYTGPAPSTYSYTPLYVWQTRLHCIGRLHTLGQHPVPTPTHHSMSADKVTL